MGQRFTTGPRITPIGYPPLETSGVYTMESSTNVVTTDTAIFETGTITHNGHEFTANGAYISADVVVGYVKPYRHGDQYGQIVTWTGDPIGVYRVTSRWHRYSNKLGRYAMESIVATINHGPAKGTYKGRYGSDWSDVITLRKSKHA